MSVLSLPGRIRADWALESSEDDYEEQKALFSHQHEDKARSSSPSLLAEEVSPSQEESEKDSSQLVNPYSNKVNVSGSKVQSPTPF